MILRPSYIWDARFLKVNFLATDKTNFPDTNFGGLFHVSTASTHSPHNFPGSGYHFDVTELLDSCQEARLSPAEKTEQGVTRRTNKMGSGHFAQYERSFYIDSTYVPYPPLPPVLC